MTEQAVAAREQLCTDRISNCTALYAPLNDFCFISPNAQFRLSATFTILPIPSLRYFSGAVQDRADGPGGITLSHRFCAVARMKMAQRGIEGLAAESAAREQVALLDKIIMAALKSLGQSLMSTSRLA